METIGKITVTFILFILEYILYGFIVSTYVRWFAVPILGFHEISIIEGLGLYLLMSLFHGKSFKAEVDVKDKNFSDLIYEAIGRIIGVGIVALGIGYVVAKML